MTDPTAPEILARLGTLPLREQLVTLHAIMIAIPALQRSYPLKARMAAIRSVLRLTETELADILKDAARRSARLKEELAG